MFPSYVYRAELAGIVDGDTIDLMVDKGFEDYSLKRFRLYGLDTPEITARHKRPVEYAAGMAASDFVHRWFLEVGQTGRWGPSVVIRSHKIGKTPSTGKYGRYLIELYPLGPLPLEGTELSLNVALIKAGHAEVAYY